MGQFPQNPFCGYGMDHNAEAPVDPRRPIDRFLGNYAEDHRDPTNQLIHWLCVPPIVWTVLALVWAIPVPPALGRQGLWAGLLMALVLIWYWRLSRPLALAMTVAFVGLGFLTHYLHFLLGTQGLIVAAVAVFVVAWVGQFIGHHFEGRRPSFFTDLVYLLVGPLWLMAKLFRRLGLRY